MGGEKKCIECLEKGYINAVIIIIITDDDVVVRLLLLLFLLFISNKRFCQNCTCLTQGAAYL